MSPHIHRDEDRMAAAWVNQWRQFEHEHERARFLQHLRGYASTHADPAVEAAVREIEGQTP